MPCHSEKGTDVSSQQGMSRRDLLKAAGAAGALMATGGCPCPSMPADKTNVLLIVVDQMRYPTAFSPGATLPGYERLAQEGLTFNNFFTSAVPCSASRATFFTGLHQDQHGIYTNVAMGPIPGDGSMDPSITTLGHLFKGAGYRTPYIGKWHLSEKSDYSENGLQPYGFDEWDGPDVWGLPMQGVMEDEAIADDTIDWLRRNHRDAPWFLTCSLVNPHDIMYYRRATLGENLVPQVHDTLAPSWPDTLEDKPLAQQQYQAVYGMINGTPPDAPERVWLRYLDYYYHLTKSVDDQVARLLEALDDLGLADDTLVIFWSDHGEMAGSHRLQSKGPFMYHDNIHVPLVMRWPGRIAAGVQESALSQTVDFFPTLLDLVGIENPCQGRSGHSLAPLITGDGVFEPNPHVMMSWGYSNGSDFMQLAGLGPVPEFTAPMMLHALYDGRYKIGRYFDVTTPDVEYEMYDLANDPDEMMNLAGEPGYAALETEMRDKLTAAEASDMAPIGRNCWA